MNGNLKYKFKLQPLLNRERIYEDEYSRKLKVVRDSFDEEVEILTKLMEREKTNQDELKKKKQNHITPAELMGYETYFARLDNDIYESKLRLVEITKRLQAAQMELSKIVQKRKALEKLEEREREEHTNALNVFMNKEMDDIAISKFIHNKLAIERS